eukprot:355911-Chlamydomonas_euryale.AAC.4
MRAFKVTSVCPGHIGVSRSHRCVQASPWLRMPLVKQVASAPIVSSLHKHALVDAPAGKPNGDVQTRAHVSRASHTTWLGFRGTPGPLDQGLTYGPSPSDCPAHMEFTGFWGTLNPKP